MYPNAPRTAFVYADTDSVKATDELDFSKFNSRRIKDAKRSGAFADDPKGNTHYMGVFECEGRYDFFRTLGAKRYCTEKRGKLEITVAGVPKGKGSHYLMKIGGIEKFNFDLVFPGCLTGKSGAVYHDDIDEVRIVGHHKVHLTRNVTIVSVDYFMKLYPSYREILESVQEYLDKTRFSDYNKKW